MICEECYGKNPWCKLCEGSGVACDADYPDLSPPDDSRVPVPDPWALWRDTGSDGGG